MATLNIKQAKDILFKIFDHAINNDGVQPPVALHSSPGIGKSAVTRDVVDEIQEKYSKTNIGFRDLRLSGMESADVQGIPHVCPNTGQMKFSTPEWFPTEDEPYGILFLDELPNADIDVQKAGYRLVHDRTIQNGSKLPDGWLVVMAGNHKEDKTGANRLLPALANRFGTHIDVMPDSEAFIDYAFKQDLHPAVTSFLMTNPQFVHKFDPKNTEDHSFPSPRSWEFVSNYLKMFDYQNEESGPDIELSALVSGAIGEGAATQFMSHLKYHHRLPNLDEVANGTVQHYDLDKHDVGVRYALDSALVQKIAEYRDNQKALERFRDVLMSQLDAEDHILIFKQVCSVSRDVGRKVLFSHNSPMKTIYNNVAGYLQKADKKSTK